MAAVRACFSCTQLFQHSHGKMFGYIIRLGLTEGPAQEQCSRNEDHQVLS